MKRFRLDVDAKADLVSIHDYIARQNRAAADRVIDNLKRSFRLLATQPLMGEARFGIAPNLRCFVVSNYAVFYRPTRGGIEVARVIHAARDIEAQF